MRETVYQGSRYLGLNPVPNYVKQDYRVPRE
jgi:hypothetical protein